MKIFSNKKGQSLVEVTVAMSILAVVLTGVVTLAVNAAGLMVSSRSRTEATAYAQQGLEVLKSKPSNSCYVLGSSDLANGLNKSMDTGNTFYTRTFDVSDPPNSIDTGGYALVTIKVSWTNGSGGNITLKQIMKRK